MNCYPDCDLDFPQALAEHRPQPSAQPPAVSPPAASPQSRPPHTDAPQATRVAPQVPHLPTRHEWALHCSHVLVRPVLLALLLCFHHASPAQLLQLGLPAQEPNVHHAGLAYPYRASWPVLFPRDVLVMMCAHQAGRSPPAVPARVSQCLSLCSI